ncbi:hypothetical protein [Granulicella arctica]|uniref:Uncharacterized protein n=1 Tax=Granulicella arctica TaxID=940613 RepID=A0A7Y9PG06_9BACT|nr:hypothetical protein [Granulicella arctica]NYF79237.1 hypothetical protein [Granulicella arctica]
MTNIGWSLVDVASLLLESEEREAVRGDLEEINEGAWSGLLDVLGLIVRREAALWKSWQPWLAAFGLAFPSSFLLMGLSLSVSRTSQHWINPQADGLAMGSAWLLICHVLLLIGWSWSGGFVVGSLSRRTLWVSIAATCSPCLFCLTRFGVQSLPPVCLFLFLAPAIWGVRQGLRRTRIQLSWAVILAALVTVLMVFTWSNVGLWALNWALLWPAWYMVATARSNDGWKKRVW